MPRERTCGLAGRAVLRAAPCCAGTGSRPTTAEDVGNAGWAEGGGARGQPAGCMCGEAGASSDGLFSGASAPLSDAIGALGLARLEPLDKLHGCHFDLLDDRHFQDSGPLPACVLRHCGCGCGCTSLRFLLPRAPATRGPAARPHSSASYRHTGPHSGAKLRTVARHFLSLVGAHGGLILLELAGPLCPRLAVGTCSVLHTYRSLSVRTASA